MKTRKEEVTKETENIVATKFSRSGNTELSSLQNCKAYKLRQQLNNGIPMSREQKNWLTEEVQGNCFFKDSIPLMGYRFCFSDVLKRFFVKQYGRISEYYAVDKTSLRASLCGRIDLIVEITC